MKRELASAYAATAAKVASWAFVSALVFRAAGAPALAMLVLIRGTIGFLNYTSFGLGPAMIRLLAGSAAADHDFRTPSSPIGSRAPMPAAVVYSSALAIALASAVGGFAIAAAYGLLFDRIYHVPAVLAGTMAGVVCSMGAGTVLRVVSDAPGALLQSCRRITRDNLLLLGSELLWAALCLLSKAWRVRDPDLLLQWVAIMYGLSGAALALARTRQAGRISGLYWPDWNQVRSATAMALLTFGLLVWVARLADFLYAPTDFILINRFLNPNDVATYTPAVQIDAALLMLVGALASVMLPKAALAHGAGDSATLRRYYRNGTAAALGILTVAALAVWAACPLIFRLWFHNPMRATQIILPLLLIHTVIGGSSAPGGAILLATGRVRPYTISVLLAGTANVVTSYVLAVTLHMGLRGIVLGTIVAVVGRCGIWMPWYVSRTLAVHPAGFDVLPRTDH